MTLQALGYVGIGSDKLEDWVGYATRFLGMQLVEKSRNSVALRMDDRKQRVIVSAEAPGASFYGWEVADADALDALAGRLEAAGVTVSRGGQALAAQRRVTDLIVFAGCGSPCVRTTNVFQRSQVNMRWVYGA